MNRVSNGKFDYLYTKRRFEETFFEVHGQLILAPQCYYCGEMATTQDHTFPQAAIEKAIGTDFMPPANRLVIVPACPECNSLLSDNVFPDLMKRKAYLKKRLRQRYKKLLSAPDWTDSEISQIKGRLREYIIINEAKKEIVLRRIAF